MIEPEVENRFKNAREALAVLKGKKQNPININSSISKKTVISGSIILLGLLMLLNSYKWGILSHFGIVPKNICEHKVLES